MKEPDNRIVIFKTEDGKISVDTRFDEETAWLSLDQMAELFERDKSTISRHIKNVYDEGELEQSATVAKFATVQTEGARQVERQIEYYNLDVIISVKQAMEKAEKEFETYRARETRQMESDFDRAVKLLTRREAGNDIE
jgi:hypothetical protein